MSVPTTHRRAVIDHDSGPDAMTLGDESTDLHTRLVSSPLGRRAVTVGVAIVAFLFIFLPNMPVGPMRSGIEPLWAPAEDLGMVQNWGVFSPDPRGYSLDIVATIEHGDGQAESWTYDRLNPFVGGYREYRWAKWLEAVAMDQDLGLRPKTAQWLAETHRRNGQLPDRVEITILKREHYPLGTEAPYDGEWEADETHIWENGE